MNYLIEILDPDFELPHQDPEQLNDIETDINLDKVEI